MSHVCSEDREEERKKKKAFMSDTSVSCFLASIQRFILCMLILSTGGIRKEQFLLQNILVRIILESLLSELYIFSNTEKMVHVISWQRLLLDL